jgi:hypothetical protein
VTRIVALVAAALLAATDLPGQSLADRIVSVRSGTVSFRFQPRPGVCASEDGGIQFIGSSRRSGDWVSREPCVKGLVLVTMARDGNDIVSVRTRIATRRPDLAEMTDLGEVPGAEAGHYLATLARRVSGRNADAALTGAAMADDYEMWADFRQIVLDPNASSTVRQQALFWIGQSDTSTPKLIALYAELNPASLREHYTFVLSQRRDDDAALDKLIDVARNDRDASVRKQAMFWLGQSHDPKALKFFREVLIP